MREWLPRIQMAQCKKRRAWVGGRENDVSENLTPKFPSKGGAMSHTPLPPAPRKVHLWCTFFALSAMNGPLPAELKFRENTALATITAF